MKPRFARADIGIVHKESSGAKLVHLITTRLGGMDQPSCSWRICNCCSLWWLTFKFQRRFRCQGRIGKSHLLPYATCHVRWQCAYHRAAASFFQKFSALDRSVKKLINCCRLALRSNIKLSWPLISQLDWAIRFVGEASKRGQDQALWIYCPEKWTRVPKNVSVEADSLLVFVNGLLLPYA